MNNQNKDLGKILVVLLILAVLFLGIIWLRNKNTQVVKSPSETKKEDREQVTVQKPTVIPTVNKNVASYSLVPSQSKVNLGQNVVLSVNFDTLGKKIDGADAVLRFDPNFLESDKNIQPGDYFEVYPRKDVDNTGGFIKVSAFSVKNEDTKGKITLFQVAFKAKKAGKTEVRVEFQKGTTNLSTLVEKDTSKNILGRVGNATIIIQN